MLDSMAWLKLLGGLEAATSTGVLEWQRTGQPPGNSINALATAMMEALTRQKQFVARTATTQYELSAVNSYDRAPFELVVIELGGANAKLLDSLRSSTAVGDMDTYQLNQRLEQLFHLVDSHVQSPDEVVDRLLGELGQ